jgi:hypothetical protein
MLDERNRVSSRAIIVFLFTEIVGCRQQGVGSRLDRFLCPVPGFSSYLGYGYQWKNVTIELVGDAIGFKLRGTLSDPWNCIVGWAQPR